MRRVGKALMSAPSASNRHRPTAATRPLMPSVRDRAVRNRVERCARKSMRQAGGLLFDFQFVLLPAGESAFDLHHGITMGGKLHRSFRTEMTDLGIAI